MAIKEMPIEEKYDKLLDMFLMGYATSTTLIKELGAEDKFLDLYVKAYKKMLPGYLGIALRVLRGISPGRTFRQTMDQVAYSEQMMIPLSNIEYTMGDREATLRVKNCPVLKRMRDILKKLDLDIDAKEIMCKFDQKVMPEMSKEFGVDMTMELEENGCRVTTKLK